MARSTETFSKKEKEKKRLKKAKDKKEKAEDRKANSDKGKSLEEMFAYVDENGNITSTPPDLSKKKKEINSEDIQIGVARQEPIPHDTVRKGTVTMFNESKGFGFIRDQQTQESIFVHINGLIDPIKEGNSVTFETEQGLKGLNAIKVKKA
ncbi:cold-shock protein [Pedobacter sp. SYSU D00535]|uniref:cold-shock protein n=1 Tax=Pedobacter sp. SYSU D00535 TaxID=2810308 RepID=UPI001A96023A|nr:cold shock domain-containing protein [Pedobacter sp. SYSU D00535]